MRNPVCLHPGLHFILPLFYFHCFNRYIWHTSFSFSLIKLHLFLADGRLITLIRVSLSHLPCLYLLHLNPSSLPPTLTSSSFFWWYCGFVLQRQALYCLSHFSSSFFFFLIYFTFVIYKAILCFPFSFCMSTGSQQQEPSQTIIIVSLLDFSEVTPNSVSRIRCLDLVNATVVVLRIWFMFSFEVTP
jgi:hypothetical protein